MNQESKELLAKFRNSSHYTWGKDLDNKLEAVIRSALEQHDYEILNPFVSVPIPYSGTFPDGPSATWHNLCIDVIVPALHTHDDPSVIEAVCVGLRDYGNADVGKHSFHRVGFEFLKSQGPRACEPLCRLVAAGVTTRGNTMQSTMWRSAVELLVEQHCEKAAPSIAQGAIRKFLQSGPGLNSPIDLAVWAIVTLDAPDTEAVLAAPLSHSADKVKYHWINSLGKYGNRRALGLLQNRVGGLFKKPAESDPECRKRIQSAITQIKRRP